MLTKLSSKILENQLEPRPKAEKRKRPIKLTDIGKPQDPRHCIHIPGKQVDDKLQGLTLLKIEDSNVYVSSDYVNSMIDTNLESPTFNGVERSVDGDDAPTSSSLHRADSGDYASINRGDEKGLQSNEWAVTPETEKPAPPVRQHYDRVPESPEKVSPSTPVIFWEKKKPPVPPICKKPNLIPLSQIEEYPPEVPAEPEDDAEEIQSPEYVNHDILAEAALINELEACMLERKQLVAQLNQVHPRQSNESDESFIPAQIIIPDTSSPSPSPRLRNKGPRKPPTKRRTIFFCESDENQH